MPKDTLWLNKTKEYIVLDSTEKISDEYLDILIGYSKDDSVTYFEYDPTIIYNELKPINKKRVIEKKLSEVDFLKEKQFYDTIANYFEILLFVGFFIAIFYFRYIVNKKKNNPFEDYSDWIEIGSGPLDDASEEENEAYKNKRKIINPPILIYDGKHLNFKLEEIRTVLTKRFAFYNTLNSERKIFFVQRVLKFIKTKDFKIHDKNGFKEMPILLAATAIQLSFGLEDYLLPHYKNIHIFPAEFLGLDPSIRFLVGNVSKNNINISWKHFLKGYDSYNDGHNVGLHEMAHAYYCQFFIFDENENIFKQNYKIFRSDIATTIAIDKNSKEKLFSDNAYKNEQEFWAESVELFFEKPNELKNLYPSLYTKMSALLNQDLANNPA
jgi:MtfA peptidase